MNLEVNIGTHTLHRITEWVRFKEATMVQPHLVQPPCSSKVILEPMAHVSGFFLLKSKIT